MLLKTVLQVNTAIPQHQYEWSQGCGEVTVGSHHNGPSTEIFVIFFELGTNCIFLQGDPLFQFELHILFFDSSRAALDESLFIIIPFVLYWALVLSLRLSFPETTCFSSHPFLFKMLFF